MSCNLRSSGFPLMRADEAEGAIRVTYEAFGADVYDGFGADVSATRLEQMFIRSNKGKKCLKNVQQLEFASGTLEQGCASLTNGSKRLWYHLI